MNLRPRFFLLTALFFLVIAGPSWFAVRSIAEGIVEQWAVRHAEIQVRYDKSRTLQPIVREVALARQMANSLTLRRWAADPENVLLERQALAEAESFRQSFRDKSYFLALTKNARYYHNNASNEFAGREFRYVLKPGASKDAWFFDLIRQKRDMHINVNPDVDLGITKLWIDVLIRDGNEILGMAGTGLDLTSFINDVVEEHVPGVTSLFVDHAGAIQIHRNQELIDFGSVSKDSTQRNTIRLLLDREEDLTAVMAAMKSLESQDQSVTTLFVDVQGKRHLAGIAYLPEIDWYEITLMDLDVLLPFSQFTGLLVFYALTLVGLMLLFHLALRRYVLVPLVKLNTAMSSVETGQDATHELQQIGSGEIRQLMQRFIKMTQAVTEARRDLEAKVQERTAALERLSQLDPLTELLNRRGMAKRLDIELQRATREASALGILWIDVDQFKDINDLHGHAVGDEALKTIARLIENAVRPYDAVARWGGDEFLVMLANASQPTLDALGERLRADIAGCRSVTTASGDVVPLTVSIGGHLQKNGDSIDTMLLRGDQALFAAKARQRNIYVSSEALAA
ncbi:MAG TPA: diguanylate cyclase [Macromonas sp.]|nr:diguanylate cyclase [Macromonas sp.]